MPRRLPRSSWRRASRRRVPRQPVGLLFDRCESAAPRAPATSLPTTVSASFSGRCSAVPTARS